MNAPVITVPAFASARDGVRHFFGTRRHADSLAFDVGVPARQSGTQGRGWLLSVKQVHGTEALVVDRPIIESDRVDPCRLARRCGWDYFKDPHADGEPIRVEAVGSASQYWALGRSLLL